MSRPKRIANVPWMIWASASIAVGGTKEGRGGVGDASCLTFNSVSADAVCIDDRDCASYTLTRIWSVLIGPRHVHFFAHEADWSEHVGESSFVCNC